MTEPVHSHYGPSSIERWTACLAAPRMAAQAPAGYDEPWTTEGKVAHALLQKMLVEQADDASKFVGTAITYESETDGEVAAVIKPDAARAVQIALDQVYELIEGEEHRIWIETRVKVPLQSIDEMWGTADILIYLPKHKRLIAIDYKHGAGIFVDVKDNKQVKAYALGALHSLRVEGVVEVWLGIVQPRAFSDEGSIRWDKRVTFLDLLDYQQWLDERAALTLEPDAPFKADPKYCRWCPAAAICPEYERRSLEGTGFASLVEVTTRPALDPKKLPLDRISMLLRAEGYLRGLFKAARSVAMGAATRGYDIPDYKLVNTKATRAWYGDHENIGLALSTMTGFPLDKFYPRTLITMTEAEQIVVDFFRNGVVQEAGETKKAYNGRKNKASELAHELLAQFTLKEPGGNVTLAPITDPRPRVDAAASNFAGLIHVDPQPQE